MKKKANKGSANSPDLFQQIFETIPDPVVLVETKELTLARGNKAARQLFPDYGNRPPMHTVTGTSSEDWRYFSSLLEEKDTPFLRTEFLIATPGAPPAKTASENAPETEEERTEQYNVTLSLLKTSENQPDYILVRFQNIAGQIRFEEELLEEKTRSEMTLKSIGEAVITTNERGEIDYMNPIAEKITGWKFEELWGKPFAEVAPLFSLTGDESIKDIVFRCMHEQRTFDLSPHNIKIKGHEQRSVDLNCVISPMLADGKVHGAVIAMRDVSQARRLEERLLWQATHDGLTGLFNRRQFEEELAACLSRAREDNFNGAMLYMDLDQFKLVNDICGHIAGDELLKQLTSVLKIHCDNQGRLSRLGGDEFGIILKESTIDEAKPLARQIIEAVYGYRFQWGKNTYKVGISIGIVPIHRDSISLTHVMSLADIACDTAKELGRNRYHVYIGGELEYREKHGQMQWVSRIKNALEEESLLLYQMPIVSTGAGAGAGPNSNKKEQIKGRHFEILLRMKGKNNKLIYPMEFISAAEKYNLMQMIDKWVVRNTFKALSEKKSSYIHRPGDSIYSINLSGSSMADTSFGVFVLDCFQEYNIHPQKICFEITESEAILNFNNAHRFIDEMKSVGCSFALDDFGTGLSSFAYLKALPVNWLKIDGSFVKEILNDPIDMAMIEAINEIGHIMKMETVAEYVENEQILEKVREIGIDYAQGYAIQRPFPITLKG